MCAVSLFKSGSRLAQVTSSCHHPFFRGIMATEAAAEATVGTGGVTADAPGMVDVVTTDATPAPVSAVSVVAGSFPTSSEGFSLHIDRVMRGGSLKEPYLVIGSEDVTAVYPTEFILRGGHLPHPVLLTDLELIDDRRFIHLQKWLPALCVYLTGKSPKVSPLKRTRIFESMRERIKATVAFRTQEILAALQGAPFAVDRLRPTV